jgi:hypothetical protein
MINTDPKPISDTYGYHWGPEGEMARERWLRSQSELSYLKVLIRILF